MGGLKKKNMLESVDLLEEANTELNSNIGQPEMREILMQCQETAIFLGNHLEEAYSAAEKETVENLIRILEDYCENIYQISINHEDKKTIRKLTKKIVRQLSQLRNIIMYDLPKDRTEVVFLPYKASMWDSLESVWKEADADENTDAYVIPIPYYDKNPDGSFREMHYEGDQYPDYVPVTYYETYDLEMRKPDIIFIHNPYDNSNYVTSVHPDYYVQNLRNLTDKLVYIPYFLLGDTMYKSFCVSPGTVLSHIVIAQSQKAKSDYIFYLKMWYQDNTDMNDTEIEGMLKEKILPLGSPKIDKVIYTDESLYQIPLEWKHKLEGKKTVLYNTGVTGILNGDKQELKKIRDTIDFFRSRQDIILWWRPHPLSASTIRTMRPQLYEEYISLIQEFKLSGTGIFDDTPDLHRALFLTDMYYGDDSSLVYLYGVQGKTILMQNIYYLEKEQRTIRDYSINYRISCNISNTIFFAAENYNRLYCLDLSEKSIADRGEVPQEYKMELSLYSNLIYEDGTLWLIPFRAHALASYKTDTGQWKQYDLTDQIRFSAMEGSRIYMITSDYKYLWFMDTETDELKRKRIQYLSEEKFVTNNEAYNGDLYVVNNKLYFLVTYSNILIAYDIKSDRAEINYIGSCDSRYQRLIFDENYFWCIPADMTSKIVRWDGANVWKAMDCNYPSGFFSRLGFSHAVYIDGRIVLFPESGNMVLCLHTETMKTESILKFEKCMDVQNVQLLSDDRLAFVSSEAQMNCCITVLDFDWNIVESYPVICSGGMQLNEDKMLDRLDREVYDSRWAYQIPERKEYSLSSVCGALIKNTHINRAEREYFRGLYANGNGYSGKCIWETVRDL